MWFEYGLMLLWVVGLWSKSSNLLVLASGGLILCFLKTSAEIRALAEHFKHRSFSIRDGSLVGGPPQSGVFRKHSLEVGFWDLTKYSPALRKLVAEARGLFLRCECIESSYEVSRESRDKSLEDSLFDLQRFIGALEVALVWRGHAGEVQWLSTRGAASRFRRVVKSPILGGTANWRMSSSEVSLLRLYGIGCVKTFQLSGGGGSVIFVGFESKNVGFSLLEIYRAGLLRPLEDALILKSRIGHYEDRIQETRELSHLRDVRFSHMSHDVRGPLNNVVNAARLIESAGGEADVRRYVEIILTNSRRIGSLVEGFLDFSRSGASEVEVAPETVRLNELRHEIEQMWSLEAETKGLYLRFEEEGISIPFWCDRGDFRRIVDNLVGNAIKYTENGGIELSVKRIDGNQVGISVKDSGPGMTAEQLEIARKPYKRLSTDGVNGLGLGLAATEQMVRRNGGRLQLSSFVDYGTTVSVCLPTVHARETQSGQIMLIDDDPDFLHVVKQGLNRKGWKVEFAADFDEAEQWLADGDFLALLTDWQVGDRTAEDLLARSVSMLHCGVISGHRGPPNSLQGRLEWFRKPVHLEEVHQWLEECLAPHLDE